MKWLYILSYMSFLFCLSRGGNAWSQQNMSQQFDSLYLVKLDLDTPEVERLDSSEMICLINAYYEYHTPALPLLDRATDVLYNVGSERVRSIYVLAVLRIFMEEFGYEQTVENVLQDLELCSNSEKTKQSAKEIVDRYYLVRDGAVAPECELTDIKGNLIKLSDFADKMVFICVWNSENGQSVDELSYFLKLPEKYEKENNLTFMTVFVGDTNKKDEWIRFLKDWKCIDRMPHFISGLGPESFGDLFCIQNLPRYILINQGGIIVDAWHFTVKHAFFDLGFRQELKQWNYK